MGVGGGVVFLGVLVVVGVVDGEGVGGGGVSEGGDEEGGELYFDGFGWLVGKWRFVLSRWFVWRFDGEDDEKRCFDVVMMVFFYR